MAQLERLIADLETSVAEHQPEAERIADPDRLIRSLKELAGMIGNGEIKDAVAEQVLYLLREMGKPDSRRKKPMLNSVLYGPPGVGKTQIGVRLAHIWHALGYLKKPEGGRGLVNTLQNVDYQKIAGYFFLAVVIYTAVSAALLWCCRKMGVSRVVVIGGALLLLLLFAGTLYWAATRGGRRPVAPPAADGRPAGAARDVAEEDIITIVDRQHFIGKYVGWTDKQTHQLLMDNRGKVLFIDEAYSLVSGDRDSFGAEALTVINKFLSEHPGEIAVIMAGYKDKIQSQIFDTQPGLPRRFMWYFDCPGYSPDELFQIFQLQVGPDLQVANPELALQAFRESADAFIHHAGSTERLAFFAQLENSRDVMGKREKARESVLTTAQLKRAIRRLRANNIDKAAAPKYSPEEIDGFLRSLALRHSGNASLRGPARAPARPPLSDDDLADLIASVRGSPGPQHAPPPF